MSFTERQSESEAPVVPARAKQGAEAQGPRGSWVEASVWNEGVLAALETASKEAHKAFFADMGLFTMTEAHALASRSR